ncbi:hypothetical protein EV426DRAFT_668639 [Tirmania nivea]|nr:hypothetical protein EV426DRAFT_668639 [Tirmania nivea]
MHHAAVPSPASNSSSVGNTNSGTPTRQGPPEGQLEKLKEAVNAHIGSQLKIRPKSKLGQAETIAASPPEIENGVGGTLSGSEGGLRAASVSNSYKKTISMTGSYFPPMLTPRGIGQILSSSAGGPHDRALPSGSATPSSFAFVPAGTNPTTPYENPDFPAPNMYELALRLHSEPGIEAFWNNLVKICTTCYRAERMSLAVPTDSSDLENTPWGQKATYTVEEDDVLSLTYMGEGGVVGDVEPETEEEESDEQSGVPISEGLGGEKGEGLRTENVANEGSDAFSTMDEQYQPLPIEGNTDQPFAPIIVGVDQYQDEQSNSEWVSEGEVASPMDSPRSPSGPGMNGLGEVIDKEDLPRGRVYSILQPLYYEADALLDSAGVLRVLQRGKTVVLSREYRDIHSQHQRAVPEKAPQNPKDDQRHAPWSTRPYHPSAQGMGARRANMHIDLPPPPPPSHPPSEPPTPLPFVSRVARRKGKRQRPKTNVSSNEQFYSSMQHQLHHSRSHSPSHSLYEEYEQSLSSPWSQSPAPSPAIKADTQENPFFTAPPNVDEDCFSPTGSSPNYSAQEPVHAIGLESASTIIHIPLIHPSLSRLFRPHKATQMKKASPSRKGKSVNNGKSYTNGAMERPTSSERKAPIAILSMLSPVIPYPSNLVHSLSHFAPLVATAFALAQAHENVYAQLQSVNQKRKVFTYPPGSLSYSSVSRSRGSVTSPSSGSTYSRLSTSTSRVASPNTESGVYQGRGVAEPKHSSDSYFTEKSKLLAKDIDPLSSNSKGLNTQVIIPKESLEWQQLRYEGEESASSETTVREKRVLKEQNVKGKGPVARESALELSSAKPLETDHISEGAGASTRSSLAFGMETPGFLRNVIRSPSDSVLPKRGHIDNHRPSRKTRPPYRKYQSEYLSSAGATYGATFSVLPELGSVKRRMASPDNNLLKMIVECLPVHVFIAAPDTGKTTWVNNKLLNYQGMTAQEYFRDPWRAYHPEDRPEFWRLWKQAVESGVSFSHQLRIANFEGEYRWFMIRANPLRDDLGAVVHWFGTNMDVHDQRLAEINAARQQEMAESEHKYRSLANSSPQIVFACTANEGITFANTQWEAYSGQTLEQTLKLGFMEFVHPQDRKKCSLPGLSFRRKQSTDLVSTGTERHRSPEVRSPGLRPKEKGKYTLRTFEVTGEDGSDGTFSAELRLRRKDSEYRWHLVRCVRVESNFGTGEGQWFGTCTDINDHKLLEQKLKEANDAAQKTMESKTRFLANMSHEIRTPLIGISGMVNFLLDTTLSGEQLDYCHTISQSSEGLLMVINDILDLSKVEAGMMRLNTSWFRIHSLIEDANELLSTMAIQKQLELNYIVEEDVPLIVGGDRVRLRQVLLNVIGNAIKFTNSGEVFSRCSVRKDAAVGEEEVMLQFECHDTGPGFDEKEEELIFKPFSQIDGSSTRAHGGSGLGLVISRQLVELHGGTMGAKSTKGEGSIFYFSARLKVNPHREETKTGPAEDIEDDHILDKGFTETPPTNPSSGEYGGTDASDSVAGEENPAYSDFVSTSERIHGQPSLGNSLVDSHPLWHSRPPEIQDKVKTYIPAMGKDSEGSVPGSPSRKGFGDSVKATRPEFSILIVSKHPWSLHSISHHIRMTLPKTSPHHIELASIYEECLERLNAERPVKLTHIVLNLPDQAEVIALLRHIHSLKGHASTSLLVLTNPLQRTIIEGAGMGESNRIQIINKPIKPSRFGSIFDPDKERDASTDRNRDSAQQVVETQKRVFTEMEKDVGNKGHRVLLVEDNPVNQKVLLRFLSRVGLEVETASDGEECVSKVFSNGSGHYALILCDLHMPRKDGFQACAEVRQWEKARKLPLVPIIALSANVMEDVVEKCAAAGFSNFVAKPVDFEELSRAIKGNLDPTKAHVLMSHPAISPIQTVPESVPVTFPLLQSLCPTRPGLFTAKLSNDGNGSDTESTPSVVPSAPASSLHSTAVHMLTNQESTDEGPSVHRDLESIPPSVCSTPEPSYGSSTPTPSYMASMVAPSSMGTMPTPSFWDSTPAQSFMAFTPKTTPAPSFTESKASSPAPSI